MSTSKKPRAPLRRRTSAVDAWSIRLIVILQGIAVIAGLLAGSSLNELSAIPEMWMKILELVAHAD